MTAADAAAEPSPQLPLIAAICVAPRRTMRWMLDHPQRRQSFAIVAAACVSILLRDLDIRLLRNVADMLGLPAVALVILLGCAIGIGVSIIAFFVFSAAAAVAGRVLGGGGTFGAVRTAVAWGLAPQVWAILYRLPAILFAPATVAALYGSARRAAPGTIEFTLFTPGVIILALLDVAFLAWYCVVGSRTLAEAHGFSSWRGLATLIIAVVLPFVLILMIIAAAFLASATT